MKAVAVKVFSSIHDMVRDVVDEEITRVESPSVVKKEVFFNE